MSEPGSNAKVAEQRPHGGLVSTSFTVIGMTCEHCVRAVTEEIGALNGVRSVHVTLSNGLVTVESDEIVDMPQITAAVAESGYAIAG